MSTSTEMMVSIRDQNVVKKRAIYTAIGINTDGERDVLGLWTQATEGARFWATVLTNLKQRGVNDILLCCTDGLTGFTQAIEASFPETVHQTCIVHLIRQSLKHLSYQDRRECAGQLRRIYTAPDQDTALAILEELEHAWADDKTRVLALGVWRRAWTQVTPFLAFPDEIRRITWVCTEFG